MHLFAILATFACTSPPVSITVTPEGGEHILPGGAGLVVPPGAVAEDTEVTARLVTDLAGWRPLGTTFDAPRFSVSLEPHGLQFLQPVELRLPHGGWTSELVALRAEGPGDPTWEPAEAVSQEGDLAKVRINGFSAYAIAAVNDGGCPCFTGNDLAQAELDYGATQLLSNDAITWYTEDYHLYGARSVLDEGCLFGLLPIDRRERGLASTEVTRDQDLACHALIRAAHDGDLYSEVHVTVNGLTEEQEVTLRHDPTGVERTLTEGVDQVAFVVPPDSSTDFEIVAAPDNVACTVNAESYGSRASVHVSCAPDGELPCNGLDDDGDGAIDEGWPDSDGDGLADLCDAHPDAGCPCFDLDAVVTAAEGSDAVCYANASIPRLGNTVTTGALTFGENDAEGGFVGVFGAEGAFQYCVSGCIADGLNDCETADNTLATLDATTAGACLDLVYAGCF